MSKNLSNITAIILEPGGVHFRYLVLQVQIEDQSKLLVRALNFRPYRDKLEQKIVNWTWKDLEERGFKESETQLTVGGGGTLNINPYYETVTLFGESPQYGPEPERKTVAQLFQKVFSEHEISWFEPGFFKEQEKIAKEKKAKLAAQRTARKVQKQSTEASRKSAQFLQKNQEKKRKDGNLP